MMNEEQRRIMKITDEILELVDNAEDYDRSDLQGVAQAIAMRAIRGTES
jgi:hypothetical protein